jgi:hypothetical protein
MLQKYNLFIEFHIRIDRFYATITDSYVLPKTAMALARWARPNEIKLSKMIS